MALHELDTRRKPDQDLPGRFDGEINGARGGDVNVTGTVGLGQD